MAKAIKYKFTLFGKPKAQERMKFTMRKNGSPLCYDPMASHKALDRTLLMSQIRDAGLMHVLAGPIDVNMTFHLGCGAKGSQSSLIGKPKPTVPDIDNLAKYYLDVMNDLIFKDDRYVTSLSCSKIYSDKKKVEIVITVI